MEAGRCGCVSSALHCSDTHNPRHHDVPKDLLCCYSCRIQFAMTLGQGDFLHDRYRIVEILGRGGMGAVYRAIDESLGVDVAVKENLFVTDDYARQFRMEAVILAGLRHPNLPRVTDHFVIEGQGQYLVMDFIEGDDLRQRMEKNGSISEEEAIQIGVAVCEALSYLHSRKPPILHRDIKPGNIRIAPEDNIYLVDFGLAKMGWENEATMTGARAMTPGYSPPEQYGSARTDARTDIYSLGATLYAGLSGFIPEDSLMRVMDGLQLTPLRKRNSKVSEHIAAVIEKALETQPANRYQTADEFKRALLGQEEEKIEESQPVSKTGKDTTSPKQKLQESQEPQETEEPEESAPAPKVKKRRSRLGCFFWFLLLIVIAVGGLYYWRPDLLSTALALVSQSAPTPAPIVIMETPTPENTPSATAIPPTATATSTVQPTQTPPATETSPAKGSPTATVASGSGAEPSATPLGGSNLIAFASTREKTPEIYVTDPSGSKVNILIHDQNGACEPAWSPDGKKLVYVSPCQDKSDIYTNSSLFIFDVDTGNVTALPTVRGGDFEPAWSPDGIHIAFTSVRDGSPQVYVIDLNSSNVTALTSPTGNIQARQPRWSPDGAQIIYTVRRFGLYQIWLMNADGSNQVQLIRSGGGVNDILPIWSPDGKSILYSEYSNSNTLSPSVLFQYSMEAHSAKRINLTPPVQDVHFSPDGNWIAYETSDSKNQDIYLYNLKDGRTQRLTISPSLDFDPAWQP